jgi:2-polyprenyl-3-methyl-5-hydroxy-6-metoxy-1,4-benzoquinol methylase
MRISVNPPRSLKERRLHAAQESGGVSAGVIGTRFLQIVEQCELRGRVLDFGAGIGQLTRRLWTIERFEQVSGLDILPRPEGLPDAISWQCLDVNEGCALSSASFDVVIAAEVIEHLENPRQVAREWYRILKPGGTVVLSTPNNESLRSLLALLVRGHFTEFGDSSYPAHITALLRKDLMRILTEAGFSGVRFEFTDSGALPKLTAATWQQVSFGLLKGRRFSDNVIAIARKTERL